MSVARRVGSANSEQNNPSSEQDDPAWENIAWHQSIVQQYLGCSFDDAMQTMAVMMTASNTS
jgi:hypothetical protein